MTSSSSASTIPLAAAIAETPQIEKPVATSSERFELSPSLRPSHCVPTNVIATTARTTISALAPESEDVGEDEVEAEEHDSRLQQRPGGEREPGAGPGGYVCDVRDGDPERDAEDEWRKAVDAGP